VSKNRKKETKIALASVVAVLVVMFAGRPAFSRQTRTIMTEKEFAEWTKTNPLPKVEVVKLRPAPRSLATDPNVPPVEMPTAEERSRLYENPSSAELDSFPAVVFGETHTVPTAEPPPTVQPPESASKSVAVATPSSVFRPTLAVLPGPSTTTTTTSPPQK
jgi:hypothetical protein